MRLLLALLLLGSWAGATNELVSPRTRVLFEDARLEPYAQRVAEAAERALAALEPYWGSHPETITLRLRDDTDLYNAFASPLPHPYVDLRALFPVAGSIGFGAEDDLYLLVLHELTHILQFAYTQRPEGAGGPRFGLVGEGVARMPPAWFVEGAATWLESELTGGGRLRDPLARGVLLSLAAEGPWPSLSEASLGVYGRWPGGATRYLLGAGFVDALVARHGFGALRATLRHYNAGAPLGTFADAWRRAVGTDLALEWDGWRLEVAAEAARRSPRTEPEPLTSSGWSTGAAALHPDGRRLAWVGANGELVTADWDGRALGEARVLRRELRPERLAWLADGSLVYNRRVRRSGSEYLELFRLEPDTDLETQLTSGARAHFPTPTPDGCLLYVRDDALAGSSLLRRCDGGTEVVWDAPPGVRIVGLAASAGGRLALSVWRSARVDLALLEDGRLRLLTDDDARDLEPSWQGETALLFSSDRGGDTFDLYRLEPGANRLERLSDTLGGAFAPLAAGEALVYRSLGAAGFDLARSELRALEAVPFALSPSPPSPAPPSHPPTDDPTGAAPFAVRPYSPWRSLEPYGWLPLVSASPGTLASALSSASPAFALSVFGQDASAQHAYGVTLGLAPGLRGPLGALHAEIGYRYRLGSGLGDGWGEAVPPAPLGFGLRLGVWPQASQGGPGSELVAGLEGTLLLTWPRDRWTWRGVARAALLYRPALGLRPEVGLEGAASRLRGDPWGYPARGLRFAASARLSPAPSGWNAGLWASASSYRPVALGPLSGTLELALRGGYRPPPPVPLRLEPFAGVVTVGYRLSLPAPLRYGDGLYALERLTLEPRLRLWHDGALGAGADLSLHADTLLNYAAPVSFGLSFGYAERFWYRMGLRLPL